MKIREALITLFSFALLGTLAYLWFAPASIKSSPDISLMSIEGEEIELASLQGKPLLVTFWSITCPGCLKEMPHLIELYNELSPRGLEIIGIAMHRDPPNHVVTMARDRNIPYPVVLDIHADAARAFGNVRLTPTSYLIAPDGRIAYRKIGRMNMARLREDILGMLGSS